MNNKSTKIYLKNKDYYKERIMRIKKQDIISLSKNNNYTFNLPEELEQEEYNVYFTDFFSGYGYDFTVAPSILTLK